MHKSSVCLGFIDVLCFVWSWKKSKVLASVLCGKLRPGKRIVSDVFWSRLWFPSVSIKWLHYRAYYPMTCCGGWSNQKRICRLWIGCQLTQLSKYSCSIFWNCALFKTFSIPIWTWAYFDFHFWPDSWFQNLTFVWLECYQVAKWSYPAVERVGQLHLTNSELSVDRNGELQ